MIKIPSIKFFLKEPSAEKETLLYLCIGTGSKRMKFSTGIKLLPQDWSTKKQVVLKSYTHYKSVNHLLGQAKQDVEGLYFKSAINKSLVTKDLLKRNVSLISNDKESESDFIKEFDNYIKFNSSKHSSSSLGIYKQTLKHLSDFSIKDQRTLSFSGLDLDFYGSLVNYFITEKSMLNATVNKQLKTLIAFLNWASDRGLNTNTAYKKFKRLPEYESSMVALNEAELNVLMTSSFNNHLDLYKDLFLLECFTGLRYSDLKHIKSSNIKDRYLSITSTKQKDKLTIPLLPGATEIIDKYLINKKGLQVPSNQKFNDALKEIGKLCKFDQEHTIVKHSGSKRIEEIKPKYELITTHTGRRTFCTIALKNGMPEQMVRMITGHKTSKSFAKYLRFDKVVLNDKLKNVFGYGN